MPARLPVSFLFFFCVLAAVPQTGGKRKVQLTDLPNIVRHLAAPGGPVGFESWVASIDTQTNDRLRRGEREHLVYFVLQSRSFTRRPPIEPAACARQFADTGVIPAEVEARMREFLAAAPRKDERLRYFRGLASTDWRDAFREAMDFLHQKEFEAGARQGEERREEVAALYATRGHSSDASFEANFAPYLALSALARDGERKIRRVLIAGPGVDYAPRTGLRDEPPQSYQPYAIADSLLRLGLARESELRIHCVDINPRVVEFLKHPPEVLTFHAGPGLREFQEFVQGFGRAIGQARGGRVTVSAAIRHAITSDRLNIVTERYDPSPGYDLIVATNVLVYAGERELILALANLASMLAPRGLLIHNDLRAEVESVGRALGIPVIDARLIRLREDDRRALMDSAVVHERQGGI